MPDFIEVVRQMQKLHSDYVYLLPTVSTVAKRVRQAVENAKLPIRVIEGEDERRAAFQNAEVAVAASGTVALELAITGVPHVVAYKVPKLTEWLARRFLHIQFVNLTNILLGYEVVPELLQQDCNPLTIMQYIEQFLAKGSLYKRQIDNFSKLRAYLGLGEQTPSDNAASAILEFINRRK